MPLYNFTAGQTSLSAQTGESGQTVFVVLGGDPENHQLQFSMTLEDANAPFTINKKCRIIVCIILYNTYACYVHYKIMP